MVLSNYFENKKICIYGFGREGISTYNYILKHNTNYEIYIKDDSKKDLSEYLKDNVYVADEDTFETVDMIIKSPGIGLAEDFKYLNKLTSETSLFMSIYRDQVIGVTGTKGKSTTSSLLANILSMDKSYKTFLVGNIGKPVFDYVDEIEDDSKIVYELSCHQLEHLTTSPKIAIFLNLYEEHLDRYKTLERYGNCKRHIYQYQKETDLLVCSSELEFDDYRSEVIKLPSNDLFFDLEKITYKDRNFNLKDIRIPLAGIHNIFNIAAIYAVCKYLNITDDYIVEGIESFIPLEHRLELVGTYRDITFYNDSISTSVESTLAATKAINNINTILVGGLDRGINYDYLCQELSTNSIENIICMYASGKRIYDGLKTDKRVILVKDLKQAVEKAFEVSKPNTVCLMSPASASYDSFKNFEERGRYFKDLVREFKVKR